MNYDSNNLVKFSDHRPVFAQFLLKTDIQTGVPQKVGSYRKSEAEYDDEVRAMNKMFKYEQNFN